MAKKKSAPWTPKRLKALRKRLGLTQKAAADKVGVVLDTWASWELGRRQPSTTAATVIRLLDEGKL